MTEPRGPLNKIDKGEKQIIPKNNQIDIMTEKMQEICNLLLEDEFDVAQTTKSLIDYLDRHERILYSPISNVIYHCYDDEENVKTAGERVGTISSNLETMFAYTETDEYKASIPSGRTKRKTYQDTPKTILKLWDHVNLAQQQYVILRQSDEEYQKKFESSIEPFKQEMTKDLTAQLLTIVGIFTALAFLVFGGISSLDNIFSNIELPLFKLLIVGSVWGLCIINLVFVFLFCVGKMTKMSFSSTQNQDATVFQKYPIVWWSNFIVCSVLFMSMWGYFITQGNIHSWLNDFSQKNKEWVSIGGTVVIFLLIIMLGVFLLKKIRITDNHDERKINK